MKLYDEYHEYRVDTQSSRVKAQAEYQKKSADEELEEAREIRHNITRLRDRVHEIAADRDRIKAENAKLRELVSHLAYVKPAQVTAITHDGKLFRFDEKLAEVGMRYEAES